MEELSWQDPYQKDSLGRKSMRREMGHPHSPSDSFADRFIGMRQGNDQNAFPDQNMQSSFSDRYHQSAQYQRPSPNDHERYHQSAQYQRPAPDDSERFHQSGGGYPDHRMEPAYDYGQINEAGRQYSAEWRFLDLKNRKQTGDLYKKILHFNKKNGSTAFCFASCRKGEGVSTIIANLVAYISNQAIDKKIMVIDANFQHPNLQKIFKIPEENYGLVDVLNSHIGIQDALKPISANISVLPCGYGANKSSGNLDAESFLKLINTCKQLVDFVLIDCPPILNSSDSLSVAPASDIFFLVIEAVKVQRQVAEKGIAALQNNECEMGGVILNRVQQVIPGWVYRFI